MSGQKHLIECHCYLKIFDDGESRVNHKFPVYSKFDNQGRVIPKLQKCNNCDTLHFIYDICKSEIIRSGKDKNVSALSKEDMMLELDSKIVNY
mgnify:CR=1 FL=1